jgi:hypothetical protein
MRATRFERTALTSFFVAGWVIFFSAAIAHAQPLYANPPPPQPPPTFNPSTPYTVPQSPETPVSPGLPSAPPGSSAVVSPSVGSPLARSLALTDGAQQLLGPLTLLRTNIGQHVHSAKWGCAVHSKSQTDLMPSGVLVHIDAGAS